MKNRPLAVQDESGPDHGGVLRRRRTREGSLRENEGDDGQAVAPPSNTLTLLHFGGMGVPPSITFAWPSSAGALIGVPPS